MKKSVKRIAVFLLSALMGVSIVGGISAKTNTASASQTIVNPIAKYEFKDKDDLGKDSMGNYDMEYRKQWVSGGTGPELNTYTAVDEVNGGVSFAGQFCLSQDKDSNMFADVTAFTLCFEMIPSKSTAWQHYLGVGNSTDEFSIIGCDGSTSNAYKTMFRMKGVNGTSNVWQSEVLFGGETPITEYQKVIIAVQPGEDLGVYVNGTKLTLTKSSAVPTDYVTASKTSYFSVGARYNGAADRASTASVRNISFYNFAMDDTCATAYNTNGQLTVENVVNIPKATGVQASFDGDATKTVLTSALSTDEMFALLNDANAEVALSNGKTVTLPITWNSVEEVDGEYFAKGTFNESKIGGFSDLGDEVSYKLSVIELKSLGAPVFSGDVLKGEIKEDMSTAEMLAMINKANVTVVFLDDRQETVEVEFTSIQLSMGKYVASAEVMIDGIKYGVVSVEIDVTVVNEGPTAELKPVAKWTFDSEETKLNDTYGRYNFQAVPKKNGDTSDLYATGAIDNGALYLDGESMMALPLLNDISENISKGFTLNFQYKQDGVFTEDREQKWSVPVSFGAKDFGSSFGAGFIIADNSGDLRIYGHDITKNVTNNEYSFYWTNKVVEYGEDVWHNVTLSARPGQFFNVYVDGELAYTAECPADWSLENDNTTFSIGGRVMWNNGYNLFKGWIDNVTIYNFAQDVEQSNAYWDKAKLIVKDMNGEIITDVSNEATFENGEMLNRELFDNLYDAQVKRRINPATVNALFDNEQSIALSVEWLGYRRENGVWYIIGQVDTENLGYATLLTGKVEIKIQAEVTRAPRLISIETAKNGTVTTDKSEAYLDDQVVITPTPNEGYLVGMVKVNGVAISQNQDGEYVYTVDGADDLTISVTFKADPNAKNEEKSDNIWAIFGCGSNILNETMIISVIALATTAVYIKRKKHF